MNKVLLINNGYPDEKNKNYCTYIKSIRECLEACDNVDFVDVLTIDLSKDKIRRYIDFYIRILKLDINKYDILYINHWSNLYYPFLFKRIRNKHVVINYHGSDLVSNSKIKRLNNYIGLRFIPRTAEVIVPSYYFKNIISKKIKNNISVIPSGGVDTKIFYKYKDEYKHNNKLKIGFCSGVTYGKGYDVVRELIQYVNKLCMNIEFNIVDYGDKKYEFKEFIKENELGLNVKYHSVVEKNKMVEFYNQMDYVIFPTRRREEALGLVSLEAMACGIPVIGSNAFAVPEYIENNLNGYLININKYEEIFKVIKELNEKEYLEYNKMSLRAREVILSKYSKEICILRYRELIERD